MTDKEKLQKLIDDATLLKEKKVNSSTPALKAWQTRVQAFLTEMFGEDDVRTKNFKKRQFYSITLDSSSDIRKCCNAIETTILELQAYLYDEIEDAKTEQAMSYDIGKIFIIHGHDGELKESVARLIEKQGIQAIILSEMTNTGKTIIEKFEENSDVGAAIALFTSDDVGGKADDKNPRQRARQNVIFECGYFMGKLGRDRVIILSEPNVEMPSDLDGVVWTNKEFWEIELLRDLNDMGFSIDLNLLL